MPVAESNDTVVSPGFIVVMGDTPYARALAQVLNAPFAERRDDDYGWLWPSSNLDSVLTTVLVVRQEASATITLRWLTEAWNYLCASGARQVRGLIIGGGNTFRQEIASRDIFARIGTHGDSLGEWASHIALGPLSRRVLDLQRSLSLLSYCPLESWRRHRAKASVVSALLSAIRDRDQSGLVAAIAAADKQDWDAVYPHSHATEIRNWLSSVTSGVTPNWERGEALLAPLME